MNNKIYRTLANLIQARMGCIARNYPHPVISSHDEAISKIMSTAPSGSGFDSGTKLDLEASNRNKIVFTTAFHHTNENGYYDGWTEHKITIRPDLIFGFDMKISGRDRNQIKDYIGDVFSAWLEEEVPS